MPDTLHILIENIRKRLKRKKNLFIIVFVINFSQSVP